MTMISKRHLLTANLLAILVCAAVACVYWTIFERVPAVTPAQAKVMMADTARPAVLVDVRPAEIFAAKHVPEAVNWPWERIAMAKDIAAVPVAYQQRRLLLVCETGLSSALAVEHLRSLGLRDLWNVSGGMNAWSLAPADPSVASPPALRPMSPLKQWIVILTAFAVKPVYLLVTLGMIVVLWKRTAADLAALRWGMIWFWLGEMACAANWLAYAGGSTLLEYLHDFGMVAGFAFVSWAGMEGMDGRLIHFSAAKERCAALPLCKRCTKYAQEPCGFRRLFLFSIPATAVLALMPLMSDFRLTTYNSDVLGSLVCYSHSMTSQLFELRLCPALALVLFATAWMVLLLKRGDPIPMSKAFFAAGLGLLGFGAIRMSLVATFSEDLMWFETWEEWTELLFVLGVAVVLWTFRAGLFDRTETFPPVTPSTTQAR